MPLFLITYELDEFSSSAHICDALAMLNGFRLAETTWLVTTSFTAIQLLGAIRHALNDNDLLFIIEVRPGDDCAALSGGRDVSDQIQRIMNQVPAGIELPVQEP